MENQTRIVISGYYGFDNIGDEAVLYCIIDKLRKNIPHVDITVLSNNPEYTSKTYKVKSVDRWYTKHIIQSLHNCDILISGGGSLLQDITSNKTVPYYLAIVAMAKLLGKQVIYYSQGIGPITNRFNRLLTKIVTNQVDAIYVRDLSSKQLLQQLGVRRPIQLSIDPVFDISPTTTISLPNAKRVGIYLREWNNIEQIVTAMVPTCKMLLKLGYHIYFISMQYKTDIKMASLIVDQLAIQLTDYTNVFIIDKQLNIHETLAYTANFDFIIGMRLHSLIIAYALNKPMIALSYDPKVENIMAEMNITHCIDIQTLTSEKLIDRINYVTSHFSDEIDIIKTTKLNKIKLVDAPIDFITNNTINILGIKISNVTMHQAVQAFDEFVNSDTLNSIFTPNPEIIMAATKDPLLKQILNNASLVVPDGIGVVIASKILKGRCLKHRVAGYDLIQNTMKASKNKQYKYYFLGSKPEIVKAAAYNMQKKYPNIDIVGYRDGYFDEDQIKHINKEITASNANILLVALGCPKQEKWIAHNAHLLPNIRVAIGVGGSFDVMSGKVKRAPKHFQNLGLEWLYRLIQQPSRFKRMLLLPTFLLKIIEKRLIASPIKNKTKKEQQQVLVE